MWIRRRAGSSPDVARTRLLARPPRSTSCSLSLGKATIAAHSEIGGALPGSSRRQPQGSRRVHESPLQLVSAADLRGRRTRSSRDGASRRDRRCARHPHVDRPRLTRVAAVSSPSSLRHELLAGCRSQLRLAAATRTTGFASTPDAIGAARTPAQHTRASRVPSSDSCAPDPLREASARHRATTRLSRLHRWINPTAPRLRLESSGPLISSDCGHARIVCDQSPLRPNAPPARQTRIPSQLTA